MEALKTDDEKRQVTESDYFSNVLGAAKEMAEYYPDYLKEKEHVVLTQMEEQVGMLLMKGYQNKEMSQALNISLNTVKFHLKNIYMKLGVKTRAKAVMELVKLKNPVRKPIKVRRRNFKILRFILNRFPFSGKRYIKVWRVKCG